MIAIILTSLIGVSFQFTEEPDNSKFLTEEQINDTKKYATFETYSAEENPFRDWTVSEVRRIMGLKGWDFQNLKELNMGDLSGLPEEFDATQQWPNCVHAIRNQGKCGSCWAFAATEVLSDRFCIASQGKVDVVLSPEDMLSCDYIDHGCNGGNPVLSWIYLRIVGVVSEKCRPQTSREGEVEKCKLFSHKCIADGVDYKKYQASGQLPSILTSVENIKRSLVKEGPVETGFMVQDDFMSYKDGIYEHTSGKLLGGHAVKIVGYGVENGVNQWKVANSWGPEWGLLGGYFKIKQGECNIEGMAVAHNPDLSKSNDFYNDFSNKSGLDQFLDQ